MKKKRFYLASHFFNRGGYLATEELAQGIEKELGEHIELYVPHRNDSINDKEANDDIITDKAVCEADLEELIKCDGVIACLDGVEVDAGVGGEVFGAKVYNAISSDPKFIIGYTTDMRRNKASDDFVRGLKENLDDLDYTKAKVKLENHKENFLYRNIMITGACDVIVSGQAKDTRHIKLIIKELKQYLYRKITEEDVNAAIDNVLKDCPKQHL